MTEQAVTSGTPPRANWRAALSGVAGSRWLYAAFSLVLLAPCYWQPRLQAGDLSSHIYNAWLAQLIESGRAEGLAIVSQTTNVLFDLMLSGLFKLAGPEWAQRLAVGTSVLVFVWGAFAFVCAVSGRRAWHPLVSISMLAYGWVFHMGFFNFYLSLGLCFWALALAWTPTITRLAAAVPLLALAYLAHALPVLWAGGLILYILIARALSAKGRAYATAAVLLALVTVHVVVARALAMRWSLQQIAVSTGVDQLWVFDGKYYVLMAVLLAVWGLLFLELLRRNGREELVGSVAFQLCIISAAAVVILPGAVLIPGFNHALVFIAERMSLAVGICVCAFLGAAKPRAHVQYGMAAAALLFFGFLYRDERALNAFEDRMQDAVARLEPGRRIVNGVEDPGLRVNALTHMIDRVCVGRCFSYANYEPSTAQFRIRVAGASPIVAATYGDSFDLQRGTYVPKEREIPLYKLDLENGRLVIRELEAGKKCGIAFWKALPDLLSKS